MKLNSATPEVADIRVYYDRQTIISSSGRIFWATVEIDCKLHGMTPDISIWLPVQCGRPVGSDACRAQVLQSARALLNRVCNFIALTSDGTAAGTDTVTERAGDCELIPLAGRSLDLTFATSSIIEGSRCLTAHNNAAGH